MITLRATLRRKEPFHFANTDDSEIFNLLEGIYGAKVGVSLDYKLECREKWYAIDVLNSPNEPLFKDTAILCGLIERLP